MSHPHRSDKIFALQPDSDGSTPMETPPQPSQTYWNFKLSKEKNNLYPTESQWADCLPPSYQSMTLDQCHDLPKELLEYAYQWAENPKRRSLYLYGAYGSGKTTYSIALLRQIFKKHPSQYVWPVYMTAKKLDSRLLAAIRSDDGDEYEIESICREEFLFIDDIDKVSATERLQMQIFEIINRRLMYNLPTIITGNSEPTEISNIFDSAVLSRMGDTQRWHIIKFPKKDLRQKKNFTHEAS